SVMGDASVWRTRRGSVAAVSGSPFPTHQRRSDGGSAVEQLDTFWLSSSGQRMFDRRSYVEGGSNGVGVRLRGVAPVPGGRPLERLQRPGFVNVDDGVELVGETCSEEVALPLRVRAVDDADGPLQAGGAQRRRG